MEPVHQQQKTPGKWESKFLPAQAVKNMLALCGHGILGNLSTDAGCTDFRTELPIEKAFSEVKRPFLGQPNTKDCILGTHRPLVRCHPQSMSVSRVVQASTHSQAQAREVIVHQVV